MWRKQQGVLLRLLKKKQRIDNNGTITSSAVKKMSKKSRVTKNITGTSVSPTLSTSTTSITSTSSKSDVDSIYKNKNDTNTAASASPVP